MKNFMGYVFALAIDLVLVYGLVLNKQIMDVSYDEVFYLVYGCIFYGLITYISCRESFGVNVLKYNKIIEV
ncbi:hypothetical protein phiAS5_ORF0055 [Aeromonas phage phiAS5]|uniref:Uncharacterized protein n=1 Tax=Aeromonas phage phiAS5 TaxID=879630 RepID=E1A2F2_9CAUD|nr:hypothetical protein phiAS5_ORF0055 [Aeromonas phage phiAS5]ADM79898.1 hypothetical protein phiAS5_ORF0055 [Aeromonas phage phiAS5]BES53332.1 hypothetical protein [Aeromonas phage phiWae14]